MPSFLQRRRQGKSKVCNNASGESCHADCFSLFTISHRPHRKKDIALSVQKAGAEALPFADGSFDAVVSTLTFCTIPDPVKALQEISRVLRPGGKFIFIEHIEAPKDTFLYYQQELLDPLQALLADGCHLVRHTEELFQSNVASSASSKEKNALFSKIEQFETLDLQMKWPICRQIAGVLVK